MNREEHKRILGEVVSDYIERRKQEADRVFVRRASPYDNRNWISYIYDPAGERSDNGFVPVFTSILLREYRLHDLLAFDESGGVGMRYIVRHYKRVRGKYMTVVAVLSEISVYEEHEKRFPGGKRLVEHAESLLEYGGKPWYSLSPIETAQGHFTFYKSRPEPWEHRKDRFAAVRSAYHLTELTDSFEVEKGAHEGEYNERQKLEFGIPAGMEPTKVDFRFAHKLLMRLGLWANLSMTRPYTRFADPSILEALSDHELPLLRSMVRGSASKTINTDELEFLNDTIDILQPISDLDAVGDFAWRIFFTFGVHLCDKGILGLCDRCSRFFLKSRKNKKYCSRASEGRDCGKKARDANYYKRHQDYICAYNREEMRETRAFDKAVMEADGLDGPPTES